MNSMFRLVGGVFLSSAAVAQTAPSALTTAPAAQPTTSVTAIQAMKVAAPAQGTAVLPANTDVILRLSQDVNSKRMKTGETFRLSVVQDVMVGNYIAIPRGTPATGEVGYRTGKGAFGKSAKMEIDIRSIELNGRSIPMTGHFRQEGEGNTGATVGAAVAVGVFAVFVTGRSAIFKEGREFRAATRDPLTLTLAN